MRARTTSPRACRHSRRKGPRASSEGEDHSGGPLDSPVFPGESEMSAPVHAYADLVLSLRPPLLPGRAAVAVGSVALVPSLPGCGGEGRDPLKAVKARAGPVPPASPTATLAPPPTTATAKTD